MKRFAKFIGIGGLATLLQYAIMIIFIEWLLVAEVAASAMAYGISAIVNYLANYHWTFQSDKNHLHTFPKFALVACSGLLLNTLVFYLLFQLIAHYLVAQLIATVVTLLFNFTAHKIWIYRK